jgi:hypothetical protein
MAWAASTVALYFLGGLCFACLYAEKHGEDYIRKNKAEILILSLLWPVLMVAGVITVMLDR